jgi:hypothetical protein
VFNAENLWLFKQGKLASGPMLIEEVVNAAYLNSEYFNKVALGVS